MSHPRCARCADVLEGGVMSNPGGDGSICIRCHEKAGEEAEEEALERRLTSAHLQGKRDGIEDAAGNFRRMSGEAYAMGRDERAKQLRTTAEQLARLAEEAGERFEKHEAKRTSEEPDS